MVKYGKGYNDMTDPAPIYVVPVNTDLNWSDKKTALLTNRVDSIVERAIEELSK